MTSLVDSYNRQAAGDYRLRVLNDDFKLRHPLLAEALTGVLTEDGKTLALPPCKLLVWADGGLVESCLIPEVGAKRAFLSLERGLCDWADAVNAQLGNGFKWSSARRQKNS